MGSEFKGQKRPQEAFKARLRLDRELGRIGDSFACQLARRRQFDLRNWYQQSEPGRSAHWRRLLTPVEHVRE